MAAEKASSEIRVVTEFAKYFGKPPDRLGLNEVRT